MKTKTLALTIIICILCLTSCSGVSKNTTDNDMTVMAGMTDNNEVEKTLNLGKFSGIKSEVSLDIHYTQGSKRSVRISARQDVIDQTDISVMDGVLVLKKKNDDPEYKNNNEKNKITMYLTAPDINSLENTGIMGFRTGTFNSDGLLIRNKGILNLKTQDIHANGANGMQIHNSGKLNADVPTINATLMLVDNDGIMTLNNSDIKGGSLTIDNSGKIDLSANVEGSSAKLKNSGISRMEGSLALTGDYDCTNSGKLTIEGGVKGATAELKNSGIYKMEGSFSLTDAYTYTNSGRSDITGNVTARTISMKNSGIDDKHGALKADQLTIRHELQGRRRTGKLQRYRQLRHGTRMSQHRDKIERKNKSNAVGNGRQDNIRRIGSVAHRHIQAEQVLTTGPTTSLDNNGGRQSCARLQ